MKGEERVGLEGADCASPRRAVDETEPRTALGLPAVVLDVRPAAEHQAQRIDDEGPLGEHEPALGEPERVHVGGLVDADLSQHLGLAGVRAQEEEAVRVARAELGRVVERSARRAVEVRVSGREDARRLVGDPGVLERLGVELDRDRRLGHRDEALAELHQVDVRVVGELGREHRRDAREQRAARVGGELRVGDLARLARGAIGVRLEKAARVGDLAAGDREAVQHREAVEPVVHRALADLPLRRAGAQQRALEPAGERPLDGQARDAGLVVERLEASSRRGRAALRHCHPAPLVVVRVNRTTGGTVNPCRPTPAFRPRTRRPTSAARGGASSWRGSPGACAASPVT